MSKKLQAPLGPLEVEAKAMNEAIAFAWDMGIHKAIFEGDSQVVLNALSGISASPIQIANNILGSLFEIYQFRSVQFQHVSCSRNTLAQYARDIPNYIS